MRPKNRHASSYHKAQAGLPERNSGLPGTEPAEFKGTPGPKQSPQILGVVAAKNPWPEGLPGQSSKGGTGLREQPWLHRARSPGVRVLPVPGWRADGRGCQGDTCQWCGQLAAKARSKEQTPRPDTGWAASDFTMAPPAQPDHKGSQQLAWCHCLAARGGFCGLPAALLSACPPPTPTPGCTRRAFHRAPWDQVGLSKTKETENVRIQGQAIGAGEA